MPAPLSIIIPALNAAADLPLCLESLMPGLEAALIREVIVADQGSTDATVKIAEATGARVIAAKVQPVQAGVSEARGDWLLILPAATALSREWAERAGDHIDTRPGKAAFFELRYRSDDRRARALEKDAARYSEKLGQPLPEQGLLLSRRLYGQVSGGSGSLVRALGKDRLFQLNAQARASAADLEHSGWKRPRPSGGGYWRTLFAAKGKA
ncbi:MAG: glycosyl transferase [Hyphomonas sp.]|uniref:glycosyltransferase n=1 Tax=Hyphomonas sp. TaxID=87 RepID=UPI001DEE84C1|nr:glycosyltransferase [Hyphomonas sp.]MBA4225239.1 glycosyl transferase [Hyphomonas sp.]